MLGIKLICRASCCDADGSGRLTVAVEVSERVAPKRPKLCRLNVGYPLAVRTDNGPEFTSRAFMAWAHRALGDVTVASIFVDRLQFLPHEDFDT